MSEDKFASAKNIKPGDTIWCVSHYSVRKPVPYTAIAVSASGRVSIQKGRNGQPIYDSSLVFGTYQEARALIIKREQERVEAIRRALEHAEGDLAQALALPEEPGEKP